MNKKDIAQIEEMVDSKIRRAFEDYKKTTTSVFDCPNCKHQTMANTTLDYVPPPFLNTAHIFGIPIYSTKDKTTCLNCGKTFVEEETKRWVEEKPPKNKATNTQ